MEEEKKKNEFGKGLAIGGLVGLGLGIAGTCIAAAVIDSNSGDYEPEIEEKETTEEKSDMDEEDSEKENTIGDVLSRIILIDIDKSVDSE